MTGDLELEVRSCESFKELKDVMIKMAEAIDLVEIDSRLDKVEDRLRAVEDAQ